MPTRHNRAYSINSSPTVRFRRYLLLLLLLLILAPQTSQISFETWRELHNKTYRDEREESLRRHIYLDNLEFVHRSTERGSSSPNLGPFGDLTHEEFLTVVRDEAVLEKEEGTAMSCSNWSSRGASSPDYIDWRDKQAVTGVLKQPATCKGNAYAIAALGAVTGQWAKVSKRKIAFSEQQVVDCSGSEGNVGCHYGSASRTFAYIKNNGGIATRKNYPSTGGKRQCRKHVKLGPTVSGCYTVPSKDETELKQLVGVMGPVTAILDVSPRSFMFYRNGVYYDRTCHPSYATHHVLIIGYGREKDPAFGRYVDYWLVKNSWGTEWGDRGYMKIARNMNNHCGIASRVLLPQVHK